MNPTSKILSQIPRTSLDRIVHAILFAFDAHKNQKRKVGESYIMHPLRVALQVLVMGESVETIIAAVLHDVIEDTSVTISEISAKFGERVATIVTALTKPPRGTPNRTAIYTKQLMNASRETKLIKLLDIEDNLYDADQAFPPDKAASYHEKQTKLTKLLKGPN